MHSCIQQKQAVGCLQELCHPAGAGNAPQDHGASAEMLKVIASFLLEMSVKQPASAAARHIIILLQTFFSFLHSSPLKGLHTHVVRN